MECDSPGQFPEINEMEYGVKIGLLARHGNTQLSVLRHFRDMKVPYNQLLLTKVGILNAECIDYIFGILYDEYLEANCLKHHQNIQLVIKGAAPNVAQL
jgi:hypothetical protein